MRALVIRIRPLGVVVTVRGAVTVVAADVVGSVLRAEPKRAVPAVVNVDVLVPVVRLMVSGAIIPVVLGVAAVALAMPVGVIAVVTPDTASGDGVAPDEMVGVSAVRPLAVIAFAVDAPTVGAAVVPTVVAVPLVVFVALNVVEPTVNGAVVAVPVVAGVPPAERPGTTKSPRRPA